MTQVSLSTSTTFNGDLNALVENQGTDVTFRIDLDEAAPAEGTRVYFDSDTVQIFNRLDLPAARTNPRVENINLLSVSTNVDDSGLAFTINPGATFATVTLTIFDNDEPDTFLPATFDGRVDAEFFVRTASEVSQEDAAAITGLSDYTVNPNAASSVVIFVDDASQLPGETTNTPTVGITLDKSDVVEGESITLTINVDGEIPTEGLRVFINDTANAQSSMTRSLTEFDVANVQLTGIDGFPEPAEGDSGFFVTVTESTATVTLPILDDGFDEDEAAEVFTFEVIDEDAYEVDANASSVTLSIADNEVAVNPRSSDFEDGTVQGWTVGQPGNHFAPPTNIASGGPDGAEDNYLRAQSQGGGGVGSRLVWFNQSADWRGNYIEDGATSIKASLINEGSEDVVIRVGFDGPGGRFVTTEGITLTPGSGWQEATFSIEPEDLTAVGGNNVEATLSNVEQIRFLNNATPSYQGAAVPAQVGVDDITFTSTTTSLPTVSVSTTTPVVSEDENPTINVTFTVDGPIPEGGVPITIAGDFTTFFAPGFLDGNVPSVITPEDGFIPIANRDPEFDINLTAPVLTFEGTVFDDIIEEEPLTLDVEILGREETLIGDSVTTITVVDGDSVIPGSGPTVSLSVSDTDLSEGDQLTVNFDTEGEIPEGGLEVFVAGGATALGEFNIFNEDGTPAIELEGINEFPIQGGDDGGFFVTLAENQASITLSVFDDGPTEGLETLTFELPNGEQYEVDSNAASVSLTINDGGEDAAFAVESGVTSVFLDLPLLEEAAGLTLVGTDTDATPFSENFQVGFAITEDTDFSFAPVPFTPLGGTIEHSGTITLGLGGAEATVGEFSIGYDASRVSETASGFFVADTLEDALGLEVLFDLSAPGTATVSGEDLEISGSDLLLAPEVANALGLPDLAGADVGDARVDSEILPEPTGGWRPGDSSDLVTPPPMYEGELSPGEQANADFVDQLEGEALLNDLQDGGYVIYFRHAQTERDFADQVTADVNNYSIQRVLSEFGIQQSLAIGEGFEISQIPIGSVTTSEYGRAVKTAAIAFGEYQKDSALNFLPFEDYTDAQVEEMRANVTPLLTAVPDTGTNSIIVGHDDLFEAGAGIYPDPQGIAYLLKPDGEGEFDIIANLLPEEWVELSEGVELPDTGMANGASLIPVEDGESGNGWNPGDSFDLVTPPPTYEGELAPGEQANAEFVDLLEGQELLDELQDGGYVIYFRHAQTERDFADQVTADVNNFSTQRVLSEFGVKQSLAIGEGFELSEIPIGSVTTSEYGRAVETAAIAFNEYLKDSALNFLPFEDYTDEQVEEMRTNVLPLLTEVPETGTNSIIVGHDDLFEAGTGIYPDPQGIAYVLDPDGNGGFEIVANLLPEEWVELSQDVVPEIPVVSLSVNTTTISEEEGTLFTLSFNVNGSIPESGLEVALGGDLLPLIDQLDFSNFDFSNPDNVQGLTIGDFREDGSISITLFEPSASFSVRVFDDVVKEADANFDLMLLEGDGYSVNQDGNGATVTVTDGVMVDNPPVVSLSLSDSSVNEGEEFTVNFSVDGDVSEDNPLTVLVQSSEVGALGEFNIFNEDNTPAFTTEGIMGVPTVGDDTGSSFLVELTDTEASINLSVFNDGIGEGKETVNFALVEGERYGVDATNSQVALTIEETPVETKFEADANGEVSRFAYDSTGAGNAEVTATVDQEALAITDAAFDNLVGFYEVVDENGGIDTDGDGVADFNPGDAGYATAALENAVDGMVLRLGGNPNDDTTAGSFGESVLEGGTFYAPFAIANAGDMTVADFLAANPDNMAATSIDDQVAYFAFGEANPDRANHLKSWGDGVFGFEDLPDNLGVSDNDFNDAVFKFNFTA